MHWKTYLTSVPRIMHGAVGFSGARPFVGATVCQWLNFSPKPCNLGRGQRTLTEQLGNRILSCVNLREIEYVPRRRT